uniref:TF-B3 domain-containing protein n=1 Tax=Oryza barthii TaxID=65489 RepID=A0A0D3F4Q6_9ORYZ
MPQDVHWPQPLAALSCSRSTPPAAALNHNRSLVWYEFILKSATLDDSPGCGFFANTRVNLANDMVGLDSTRVSRACALLTMAAGGPHTNSSLVVLPSWDAGSDRCSGRSDDCFFLGWEPPFANLAAADARISFPVCVPEDLWDASNSSNSDRARLIPAMFSIMYGKVGISADTPSSTSDSFFSDSLNSSCGQSLIGMSVVQVPLAFIVAPDIFRINRDILSFVSCIVSNQIKQTCASIIQDTSDTSSNTKTDLSSDTPSNTTMTGSTKRTFNELCFCAKNVDPTADLKKYIEDLEECLDRSSKFYAVAVDNTFMKQDRVYCTKEFSQDYLKPLMEGKETISIGVQMAGGVSKNMILHMSTDGRCNLTKGWAKFATRNHIYLQSLCTFHFYKTTHLEATFDVL